MPSLEQIYQAVKERAERDRKLYERYGKPLEATHRGKYAAIASDGRVILGQDDIEVVEKAAKEFGSGSFAFCRLGEKDGAVGKWRLARGCQ